MEFSIWAEIYMPIRKACPTVDNVLFFYLEDSADEIPANEV